MLKKMITHFFSETLMTNSKLMMQASGNVTIETVHKIGQSGVTFISRQEFNFKSVLIQLLVFGHMKLREYVNAAEL